MSRVSATVGRAIPKVAVRAALSGGDACPGRAAGLLCAPAIPGGVEAARMIRPQFIQSLRVIALMAHPPLAGIGEQCVHLTKANPLQVVLGGARQERKKRQADEA